MWSAWTCFHWLRIETFQALISTAMTVRVLWNAVSASSCMQLLSVRQFWALRCVTACGPSSALKNAWSSRPTSHMRFRDTLRRITCLLSGHRPVCNDNFHTRSIKSKTQADRNSIERRAVVSGLQRPHAAEFGARSHLHASWQPFHVLSSVTSDRRTDTHYTDLRCHSPVTVTTLRPSRLRKPAATKFSPLQNFQNARGPSRWIPGAFPLGKVAATWWWKLHLVQRLRMSGSIPLLHLTPSWRRQGQRHCLAATAGHQPSLYISSVSTD